MLQIFNIVFTLPENKVLIINSYENMSNNTNAKIGNNIVIIRVSFSFFVKITAPNDEQKNRI